MAAVIAEATAALLFAIALVHFYWAGGGKTGANIAVPDLRVAGSSAQDNKWKKAFSPSKLGTATVGVTLTVLAAMVLMRAAIVEPVITYWILQCTIGLAAAVTLLRAIGDFRLVGFFKRVKGSEFARMDTLVYSPLCVLIGLGLAIVAAS